MKGGIAKQVHHMVSSRTLLKITLVIAALIITSSIVATTPTEAKSQSVQWTYQGGSSVIAGYPVLSPTGDLYVYSTDGVNATIYAVSPLGKGLWNTGVALASMPQFSADGTMFVLVDVLSNAKVNGTGLLALNPAGIMKWTFVVPGISEGMRVLPDGGVVLGAMPTSVGQHSLVCLNANGSERWTKGIYDLNSSNPMMYPVAIHGNNVLVATTSFSSPERSIITEYAPDGKVVRSFKTDFAPQSIFFAPDGTMRTVGYNLSRSTNYEYLYALNANGSVKWASLLNNVYGDLAILYDGTTVYGELTGSSGLNLDVYAVDGNGKSLWRSVNLKTIPVAFGNGMLLSNSTALMLVDRDGGIVWKFDGSFNGQPVVSGKTIYAGSGSVLMAISDSAWKLSWQPMVLLLTIIVALVGVGSLSGRTPRLD